MMECTLCRRRVGLWNYAATSSENSTEECNEDDEQSSPYVKRLKRVGIDLCVKCTIYVHTRGFWIDLWSTCTLEPH